MRLVYFILLDLWREFYLLPRHGDIWDLKEVAKANPSRRHLIAAYERYFAKLGSWIAYNSTMASPPLFPHGPVGVFISGDSRIGHDVVIFQQVTIGSNTLAGSRSAGSPRIGDSVYLGAGAKVIGGIEVGAHCRIGANATVTKSLEPHSTAVQQPTRVLQGSANDNRFYSTREGVRGHIREGSWTPET